MNAVAVQELVALDPREARRIGSLSLISYGKIFFPKTFRQKSPAFHFEIGEALYSRSRYNAYKIFRDAAKTTLLRVFCSQRIAYGISRTIMFVSVSQPHSIFSLRWLKRQVMYNKQWANAFGLSQGEKWSDEWLEIKQTLPNAEGQLEMTIITVLAMGITGQIRGFNPDDYRPDLIIADDLLNEENTATVEQRNKMSNLFFGALLNSMAPASEAPWAKAVLLGTPLHKDDLLAKCEADPDWHCKTYGVFDEKGESRWPTRWPTETLRREKEAHIRRSQFRLWMREKECKIVAGEEKAIDVRNFKTYEILPDYLDVIISIDPAPGSSKELPAEELKTDDHAIVALGFSGLDCYVLEYGLAKAVMPDKAANDFFTMVLNWNPRKGVVETIAYQKTLKWHIEQEMIKRRIFVAVEGITDKRNKANRIMQAIPGLAAYGHFFVKATMSELFTQADDYDPSVKGQADDLLDAIATGITASNPAIRALVANGSIEGEFKRIEEEQSEYPELEFGGAP